MKRPPAVLAVDHLDEQLQDPMHYLDQVEWSCMRHCPRRFLTIPSIPLLACQSSRSFALRSLFVCFLFQELPIGLIVARVMGPLFLFQEADLHPSYFLTFKAMIVEHPRTSAGM